MSDKFPTSEERAHSSGMTAARRLAMWELGDPDLADRLIEAYNTPLATNAHLDNQIGYGLDCPEAEEAGISHHWVVRANVQLCAYCRKTQAEVRGV